MSCSKPPDHASCVASKIGHELGHRTFQKLNVQSRHAMTLTLCCGIVLAVQAVISLCDYSGELFCKAIHYLLTTFPTLVSESSS